MLSEPHGLRKMPVELEAQHQSGPGTGIQMSPEQVAEKPPSQLGVSVEWR
jgi:hypothetical protein